MIQQKNFLRPLAFFNKNRYNVNMENLLMIFAGLLAAVIILTLHEFAHAFVAYKCGDPTAKWSGRMTLNPVKHFDPVGVLLFALVGFGWAKPVPVNPNNFKNKTQGAILTSAAGVTVNYITAFLFFPLFYLCRELYVSAYINGITTYGHVFLYQFSYALFAYSLSFCVFNLLPLYPLDGFRIVEAATKQRGEVYWFLRKYGNYILTFLIAFSFIANRTGNALLMQFNLLDYVMEFATDFFGKPIIKFWDLIF